MTTGLRCQPLYVDSLLIFLVMHITVQKKKSKSKRLVSSLPRHALPQLSGVSDTVISVTQIASRPSLHVRLCNSDTEQSRSERRYSDTRPSRHPLKGPAYRRDWLGEHRWHRQMFHPSLLLATLQDQWSIFPHDHPGLCCPDDVLGNYCGEVLDLNNLSTLTVHSLINRCLAVGNFLPVFPYP